MTKTVIPILQQVRTDAARDALQHSRANEHDAWFQNGWEQGWSEGNAERGRWGWFCFASGIGLSALLYGLVIA